MVSIKEFQKCFRWPCRTTTSKHLKFRCYKIELFKIFGKILEPKRCSFPNCRRRCWLIMRISKCWHILIAIRKLRKQLDDSEQLRTYNLERIPNQNNIGIVSYVTRSRSEMNNPCSRLRLLSISIHMRHHIVPNFFLTRISDIIVDVMHVFFHIGNLFVRNI